MKMDMLHRGNKLLLMLIVVVLTNSCLSYEEKLEKARQRLKEEKPELLEHRQNLLDFSENFVGRREYWQIHNDINDSIDVWANNDLGLYHYMKKDGSQTLDYKVDSILCFNEAKDKFITTLLLRCLNKSAVQDDMWDFYGVKIKGKWYFFSGSTLVLPREYYQEDIHTPLSFETLQLLSTKYRFRRYLKKDGRGNLEINDKFFNYFTSGAWCGNCKTKQQWDSAYLRQVKLNWSKRNKH